jgi:ABC-2 type transport system ATP-binding protein
MSDPAILIRQLVKSYGSVQAVRGIDLEVPGGSVFALLGPNGAGKTTTVEILEGYRERSAGEVSVLGHDPQRNEPALKKRIGIVLQTTGVEPYLTAAETIELYRGYYPHPRPLDEIVEVVGLTEKRNERVKRLSGGQQRRLDVAIGLAGDPDVLFLDEPTTGFDPAARRNAWAMIHNLRSLGKTVFLTTHYMDEAQNLADDVAIIVGGKIVARGSPKELAARAGGHTIRATIPPDAPQLPDEFAKLLLPNGRDLEVVTEEPERVLHEMTGWALQHGVKLLDLRAGAATLEDIYLQLTSTEAEGTTE